MKKLTIIAVVFATMLTSCTAESSNINPVSENVEVVDTFTAEQKAAINYCYNEIWEWDYLYSSLPAMYRFYTDNINEELTVLLWVDANNDDFDDTIAESDEWNTICKMLHKVY